MRTLLLRRLNRWRITREIQPKLDAPHVCQAAWWATADLAPLSDSRTRQIIYLNKLEKGRPPIARSGHAEGDGRRDRSDLR